MSLERIAKELEETARQTGTMADGVTSALTVLRSADAGSDAAREKAVSMIIHALQGQDRIQQRCQNLAHAVRRLIASDKAIDHPRFDEIWSSLTLEELAVPEFSGIAGHEKSGEVELF